MLCLFICIIFISICNFFFFLCFSFAFSLFCDFYYIFDLFLSLISSRFIKHHHRQPSCCSMRQEDRVNSNAWCIEMINLWLWCRSLFDAQQANFVRPTPNWANSTISIGLAPITVEMHVVHWLFLSFLCVSNNSLVFFSVCRFYVIFPFMCNGFVCRFCNGKGTHSVLEQRK